MEIGHYLPQYLGSNVLAVVLVVPAWRKPVVARVLFLVIFLGASIVKLMFALQQPRIYLEYAAGAIPLYRQFIEGVFAGNPRAFILPIAAGQFLIAVLMLTKRRWFRLGTIGGMIFFLAIAPLGVGSAFPATVIMAAAMVLLFQKGAERGFGDWLQSLNKQKRPE